MNEEEKRLPKVNFDLIMFKKRRIRHNFSRIHEKMKLVKKLNIDSQDIFKNKVFPRESFFHAHSYHFLSCVRAGELITILQMLKQNRFLLYDYDYYF